MPLRLRPLSLPASKALYQHPSVLPSCFFAWGPQWGKHAWARGGQLAGTYTSDAAGKTVYNHRTRLYQNFSQNLMPITGAQEPARTNRLPYCNDWSQTPTWTSQGGTLATGNAGTAPDGNETASELDMTPSQYCNRRQLSAPVTDGVTYCFSFWAKKVSGTSAPAIFHENIAGHYTTFSPTSEWVRYSKVFTADAAAEASGVNLGIQDRGASDRVTLLVWGAQFEVGTYPSSLIQTGASSVSVSADAFRFTNALFDAVKGQGTLLAVMRAQHDVFDLADDVGYIALTNSGDYATDGIRAAQLLSGDTDLYIESYQGGTPSQYNVSLGPNPAEWNALAFSWDEQGSNCYRALNGSTAALSLAWLPSALDGLEIGSDASANARNGFDYALVALFDRPLTEPEMVALTTNPSRFAYMPY